MKKGVVRAGACVEQNKSNGQMIVQQCALESSACQQQQQTFVSSQEIRDIGGDKCLQEWEVSVGRCQSEQICTADAAACFDKENGFQANTTTCNIRNDTTTGSASLYPGCFRENYETRLCLWRRSDCIFENANGISFGVMEYEHHASELGACTCDAVRTGACRIPSAKEDNLTPDFFCAVSSKGCDAKYSQFIPATTLFMDSLIKDESMRIYNIDCRLCESRDFPITTERSNRDTQNSKQLPIVGVVVIVILAICIVVGLFVTLRQRKRRRKSEKRELEATKPTTGMRELEWDVISLT